MTVNSVCEQVAQVRARACNSNRSAVIIQIEYGRSNLAEEIQIIEIFANIIMQRAAALIIFK